MISIGADAHSSQHVPVTGAAGFIGRYVVLQLLGRGYLVTGLENYSKPKCGPVRTTYDSSPLFSFVESAGAAMISIIPCFHTYGHDLRAANERIMASTCDTAIGFFRGGGRLTEVTHVSSLMVYESIDRQPSLEGDEPRFLSSLSSYRFQKRAVEYFARDAWDQHNVLFTMVRPFNCVGIGEQCALGDSEISSSNLKLTRSHVGPEVVPKVLKGQDPLHVLGNGDQVRLYPSERDLVRGLVEAMENPAAVNQDSNLSTAQSTAVMELAQAIWHKLNGNKRLPLAQDRPFARDVQQRVPNVDKARRVLWFEAATTLKDLLAEVVSWIERAVADGSL